jgi:membrane protease YdiL (CAAX protease family)
MGNRSGPGEIYCTNCGELNSQDGNFCFYCGELLPHREGSLDDSSESAPDSPLRAVGVAIGLSGGGLVTMGFVFLVGLVVGATFSLPPLWTLAIAGTVGQLTGFGVLAVLYLRYRGYRLESIPSYLGFRSPSVRDLGIILAGNIVILGALAGILGAGEAFSVFPEQAVSNSENPTEELGPAVYLGIVVFMLLVVAPTEEILYRGVIQNRLREQLGSSLAIVGTSIVFVLAHLQIFLVSRSLLTIALGFTALFIPALVFGYVYERTENLLLPILIHGIHNSLVVTLVFFGPDLLLRLFTFGN